MIINRYLFREIFYTLSALTLLLLLIYVSHRFLKYLTEASTGDLAAEFILQLIALRLLSDLVVILPLGFFLAILLALGRLYKDNEITAMAACGIPVPLKSLLVLGTAFALFIAVFSLFLAPWAQKQTEAMKSKINRAAETAGIAAGRFQEFSRGEGAFYVEQINPHTHDMHTIFVHFGSPRKQIIVTAERGYRTVEANELYMVLVNGHRYEKKTEDLSYVITDFAEHIIKVPQRVDAPQGETREAMPTVALLASDDRSYQAELQWRFSLPLSVIILTALAVPLSRTTPRQGQYAKTFTGVLIYLLYNNLLNIAQKWIEEDTISPWIGVWWVHGCAIIIVVILSDSRLSR